MRTNILLFLCLASPLIAESPLLQLLQSKKQVDVVESPAPEKPQETAFPSLIPPTCTGKFQTDVSLLVWQAQEDGLEFAALNQPEFPTPFATDIDAPLSTIDFPWMPAFKLLFGYHFSNPSWDLNARWTGFYVRASRSLGATLSNSGAGLLPLWIPPQAAIASIPVYVAARGILNLQLNNLDFELAYSGGISRLFFLKLHGGLKGISIIQGLRARYSGGLSDGANQMLDSHAHARAKCQGVGPRIGFGSKWMLPRGFSLIAEASGSALLSNIRTNRKDRSIGTVSGAPQTLSVQFHEAFWVWRPVIEGRAGVSWETCYGSKKGRILDVEFAYEIQEYWEQNMLTRFADSAVFYAPYNNRGNLTLHGFSFTLGLGY